MHGNLTTIVQFSASTLHLSSNDSSANDTDLLLVDFLKDFLHFSYDHTLNRSKYKLLVVCMSLFAILGSLLNILVLLVLNFRNDSMQLELNQAKNVCTNVQSRSQAQFSHSMKPIYMFVHYLACVDFFTCSIALPLTILELCSLMHSNEVYCKLFELMRAAGILLSNFLVILISFERFFLLCKPFFFNKLREVVFRRALALITLLSFCVASINASTNSVYQNLDGVETLVGICLPKLDASPLLGDALRFSIMSIFISSIFLIKILYVFIFRAAFNLKLRKFLRKKNRDEHECLSNRNKTKLNVTFIILKSNLRMALTIFLITILFYVSIIPWCLSNLRLIRYDPFMRYSFFANSVFNPVIYGFFNPNFRECCLQTLQKLANRFLFCQKTATTKTSNPV